jgi:hypothetical protein
MLRVRVPNVVHITKPVFSYSKNALILFRHVLFLVMNTSCGKQKTAGTAKGKTSASSLKIYDSLKARPQRRTEQDTKDEVDRKNDIFLAELELLERSNLIMSEAKKLVSKANMTRR